MIWTRRVLLVLPFAIALVLNILIKVLDRDARLQHIAGLAFLFATPWGWLLDRGWPIHFQSRLADQMIVYVVILWGPALLYSACVWLLFLPLSFRQKVTRRSL
ncbi:MAG: hypothetical protein ACJ71Q_00375 [Terriglobales bacterium]